MTSWMDWHTPTTATSLDDGDDAPITPRSRSRPHLRQSAMTARSPEKQSCESTVDGGDAAMRGCLRRSELAATSPLAKEITTMENADLDVIIVAMGAVIQAYARDSAQKRRPVLEPSMAFDEERHQLDASGAWRHPPTAKAVEDYTRTIVTVLELDELSLIIALVLLERAMGREHNGLVVCARTWRPALLVAIVIASKVVYDEKVFLADYREQLPALRFDEMPARELAFLNLINFNTSVRRGQYARCGRATLLPPVVQLTLAAQRALAGATLLARRSPAPLAATRAVRRYYYALEDVARSHLQPSG